MTMKNTMGTGALQRFASVLIGELLQSMPPGELRAAIRAAAGGDEVLNYEHPLIDDPVVSCASATQLRENLERRFGEVAPKPPARRWIHDGDFFLGIDTRDTILIGIDGEEVDWRLTVRWDGLEDPVATVARAQAIVDALNGEETS